MALTRYEGSENQGGVCQLRILKRCDFEANQVIFERYRGEGIIKISANDTLENVFPINYFTHFVAEHSQPTKRSQHGHYNEQGFTFALSKDRPDILAQITQLQDEPLVIIFKNNNHDWKVIGTEEDWAMIDISQETGARPSDTNQYFFDVKCASRYLSPFLEFEKREQNIEPTYCFDEPRVFSHPKTYLNEYRVMLNFLDFARAGIFKIEYSLEYNAQIILRYLNTSIIIDQRSVPAGNGEYTFFANATSNSFMMIVQPLGGLNNQSPFNTIKIHPPCLPEI